MFGAATAQARHLCALDTIAGSGWRARHGIGPRGRRAEWVTSASAHRPARAGHVPETSSQDDTPWPGTAGWGDRPHCRPGIGGTHTAPQVCGGMIRSNGPTSICSMYPTHSRQSIHEGSGGCSPCETGTSRPRLFPRRSDVAGGWANKGLC